MYTELPLVARGNILPSRFVRLDTASENGCVQAGDNTDVIGIAQAGTNKPQVTGLVDATYAAESGQQVMVAGLGSICLLEAGGTVTPGQYLKSDSQGRGVAVATSGTTIQNYGAIALQGGSSGDKIRVMVIIGKVRPALS
jgi:hypothetical protein